MKLTTLHQAIISRDDCSIEEASQQIEEMISRVNNGEDPEEVLYEDGLEPDYVIDLIHLTL